MFNLKCTAMKRKFWFVLSALVLFVAAMPLSYAVNDEKSETVMTCQDELTFTEIEVGDVPEAVIEAAKKEHPGTEIEKAREATVAGEKIYKLVLKNADGEEVIALYNSDGSNYTPNS